MDLACIFWFTRRKQWPDILDRSPLVADLLRGEGSRFSFQGNGKTYPRYYLLADGIYPQWSCFVQTIHELQGEKHSYFAQMQEGARKDVERCFGVLQARWAIICNPEMISNIMFACVVIHNMIIENELNTNLEPLYDPDAPNNLWRGVTFDQYRDFVGEVEDSNSHYSLRNDLIEHLWAIKGQCMIYSLQIYE